MAMLKHELWIESDQEQTFCLAGPMGDQARASLPLDSQMIWTVNAGNHFEAMTLYYQFMGWGTYASDHEWDHEPYSDDWREIQESRP
jgi:hypothetical protein